MVGNWGARFGKDGSYQKITHYGKTLAVLVSKHDLQRLSECEDDRSGDLATRTVDTHVSQVRKKLDLRPESGYRVVPIYNYGYRLEKIPPPG